MASEPLNPDISDMPPSPPPTPESTPSAPEPHAKQEKEYFPPRPISKLNNKKIILISIISLIITSILVWFIASRNPQNQLENNSQQESEKSNKSAFGILLEKLGLTTEDSSATSTQNSAEKDSNKDTNQDSSDNADTPTPTPAPSTSENPTSTPNPTNTPTPTPNSKTVSYTIDSFNFGYSTTNITASAGDIVRITLTNSGGNHNFVINEITGANTQVITQGKQVTIEFTIPDNPASSYAFYCSVGNHRAQGMEGTLTIN